MQKHFSVALFIFIFSFGTFAQDASKPSVSRQYNFHAYTVFDGLPQGQITSIQQDSHGFIWVGSYEGVTRYNGDEFDTYTDPLPSNSITSMTTDNKGRIVITTGAGFCFLTDGQFDCTPLDSHSKVSNLYQAFAAEDGSYWFAADGGLLHYHQQALTLYDESDGLPSPTVRSVLKDRKDRIWAGTRKGLSQLTGTSFEPFYPDIFGDALIQALLDTDEGVWIGSNVGLYRLDHQTDELIKVSNGQFGGNVILNLFEDSRGIIWIATYRGLYRLVSGQIERLSPQRGLKHVTTYTITEDNEGTIWIGSDAGLVKYVPGPFISYTKEQGMSNEFVRSMAADQEGRVWMGTRYGVSIFEPETESFTILDEKDLKTDRIRVYAVRMLPNGDMLIGTRSGLIHWQDGAVKRHYSTEDGLPSSYVSAFLVDSQQRIWVGTSRGLAQFKDEKIIPVKPSEFPIGGIYHLKQDNKERIWIGTGNQGVVLFDAEDESYRKIAQIPESSEFTVWNIDKDNDGNMWIGTNGNGLLKISEDLKLLDIYDSDNLLGNDYVWQVMVDSQGNIWCYTNIGLKRFSDGHFTHFDGDDGLPDLEGAATAVMEHPNGDLWFGTGYGVIRYVPGQETSIDDPPPIMMEGVWLGEKKLKSGVSLPNDVEALTARFSSLSFRDERDILFSYRLLGASNQWSKSFESNRLQLASLSPGDYTLEIKAIKSGRIASESPASFQFTIRAPFWMTWWFIGLCVLLVIAILISLIQYRTRRLAAEKSQLELLVTERTEELQSTNEELKRLVITDELTGLNNRRHLMTCLEQEVRRLSRCPEPAYLSFIILDADHFKTINDTYGHVIGDKVLTELAERIKTCCRQTDVAARYGGEEFAIILPFTDLVGALTLADKIKSSVATDSIKVKHNLEITMTVSLGVVSVDGDTLGDIEKECDQMIKQADAALYKAKHQGRNQVCFFESGDEQSTGS